MIFLLFTTITLVSCLHVRSVSAADSDLLQQLLPLAMKLSSSSGQMNDNMQQLLQNMENPEPKKQASNRGEKHVLIQPDDVTLTEDPELQQPLIQEALSSAIALHYRDYQRLIETTEKACHGRREQGCCHLRGVRVALRALTDLLVCYAEQWGLNLTATDQMRYWNIVHILITDQLRDLFKENGVEHLPDIERYLKNKIRIKQLFKI